MRQDALHGNFIYFIVYMLEVPTMTPDLTNRAGATPHMIASFNSQILEYTCGYCHRPTTGFIVASHRQVDITWLICINCKHGSVLDEWGIFPQPLLGNDVVGLPELISGAYDEARKSFSSKSYTACELMCRKILMTVSVDKGAKEGQGFASYIDHLLDKGYITPPMSGWVNIIRQNGNESNHEIQTPDREHAEGTLSFTTQLLKLVYEMEHHANKFAP